MQLHFSEAELNRLHTTARAAPEGRPDVSRLDALLAHIWGLINRARDHSRSADEVSLNITLGVRTRTAPPLPDSFISSPLLLAHVRAAGSAASAESVGAMATAVRETIPLFTPEKIGAMLHDAAHKMAPKRLWQAFLGSKHTLVTSWMRLRVYGVDFEGKGLGLDMCRR